ncbi:BRCT domain-containing protein [Corynebacterium choanae]|nr:BRCT domain-containing protein [Corynebacterium choanae]
MHLTLTQQHLQLSPDLLGRSLGRCDQLIPLPDIAAVRYVPAAHPLPQQVILTIAQHAQTTEQSSAGTAAGGETSSTVLVRFAPQQTEEATAFAATMQRILAGESVDSVTGGETAGVTGVILDVQAPPADWAHATSISFAAMIDGTVGTIHRFSLRGDDAVDKRTLTEAVELLVQETQRVGSEQHPATAASDADSQHRQGLLIADSLYQTCGRLKLTAKRLRVAIAPMEGVCLRGLAAGPAGDYRPPAAALQNDAAATATKATPHSIADMLVELRLRNNTDPAQRINTIADIAASWMRQQHDQAVLATAAAPQDTTLDAPVMDLASMVRAAGFLPGRLHGENQVAMLTLADAQVAYGEVAASTAPQDRNRQATTGASSTTKSPSGATESSATTASGKDSQNSSPKGGTAARSRGSSTAAQAGKRAYWKGNREKLVIPEPNPDADPEDVFYGQHVVLSGDFALIGKNDIMQALAKRGAVGQQNVTKKTTLLVAGPWPSKTSKVTKAEQYQSQGQHIEIWTDEQLYAALGISQPPTPADLEPPF